MHSVFFFTEMEDDWITLKLHANYEINIKTMEIRRRDTFYYPKIASNNGYHYITLDGRKYAVHRVVAEQFIPNPDELPEVDHIDHNRGNNQPSNLRWITHKDNLLARQPYAVSTRKYVDTLPIGAIPITKLLGRSYENYWADPYKEEILKLTRTKVKPNKYLILSVNAGSGNVAMFDINGKQYNRSPHAIIRELQNPPLPPVQNDAETNEVIRIFDEEFCE